MKLRFYPLLLFLALLTSSFTSAQIDGKLKVDVTDVKDSGKEVTIDKVSHDTDLALDKMESVMLYSQDMYKIYLQVELNQRGKKVKFQRRLYLEYPTGNRDFGRAEKDSESLKSGESNEIKGEGSGSFEINKNKLKSISISYKFNLQY